MKFWNEFIWYDAKLNHFEMLKSLKFRSKIQLENQIKISIFELVELFIVLTLTSNHYFDSRYLFDLIHKNHQFQITIMWVCPKVKMFEKNVPNLR